MDNVSLNPSPLPDPVSLPINELWASLPPQHARASLLPDTVLDGTYRIVRPIAQGGMGEVYLASHERLPGFFAVKALQADLLYHPESLSRFRREAEIVAGIRHPNVVQVFDFNLSPDGIPYLVMEYIEGADLGSELRAGRRLVPSEVLLIVRQVASALAAAHAVGVVHRDLKPENIVLVPAPGQTPVVKVIDFGISISGYSTRITTDSRVMGTPEFMSPEQALGRREEIDARSDQFALAVLAHTMLARRPPFKGDTPLATLSAIVHGQPEPLIPHVEWPADDVEKVLRKGMARTREDRYATVLEFTDALEAALSVAGALAEAPATTPAPPDMTTPPTNPALAQTDVDMAKPADDELDRIPRDWTASRVAVTVVLLMFLLGGLGAVRAAAPGEFQRGFHAARGAARTQWSRLSTAAARSVDMIGVYLHK